MQDYIVEPNLHLPHLTEHHRLFNNLPVIILNDHDCRVSGTHWHDYLQIFYTRSGSYRHNLDGEDLFPGEGTVVLDFPYLPHRIDTSQSDMSRLKIFQISVRKDMWKKYRIPFLPHAYNSASYDGRMLPAITVLSQEDRAKLDGICDELLAEYSKKSHMQANRLLSLVGNFLELLVKDCPRVVTPREESSLATRNASFDRVIELVKKNIVQGISLEDASKFSGMSRSSFTSGFRTITGKTFHNFQGQLRMQVATNMLLKSPGSIAQIAKECGYYDSSHFRLKCVEMFGIPPHELRLMMSEYTRINNKRYLDMVQRMRWTQNFDEATMQRHYHAMSFY